MAPARQPGKGKADARCHGSVVQLGTGSQAVSAERVGTSTLPSEPRALIRPVLRRCKRKQRPGALQVVELMKESWWAVQGSNLRPLPCEGTLCDDAAAKVPQESHNSFCLPCQALSGAQSLPHEIGPESRDFCPDAAKS